MNVLSRKQAIEQNILSGDLPALSDVRRFLRYNPYVAYRTKVIDAFIVGSVAKGTNNQDSDLDIAVIIPRKARKSAIKITEHYHGRFTCDSQKSKWRGIQVDLQFFYEDDIELNKYSKIYLKE
jgi:predicted nucleotidyltransferase